jgi:cyclopropane fatty-acyl-phospholipid synthase-like methyltransferase
MSKHATNEEVKEYYNNFKAHQKSLGINIRHRTINKRLLKDGLRPNSNVLEIGCGIGTVSHLVLKTVNKGQFTGVDISNDSIEVAREFNRASKNAEFVVNDMSNFERIYKYDFIVFPDVLEHIPSENHSSVFKVIASVSGPNTRVHINIPSPEFQNWLRKNHKEKMQIIDQSLDLNKLLNDANTAGFEVYSLDRYCLHYTCPDYVYIILNRKIADVDFQLKSWQKRGTENLIQKVFK